VTGARSGVSLADELPVTEIPAIPFWSENFCFVGFDPAARFGFWIHMGRWSKDNRLWREQPLLFLPDGRFALFRGVGFRASEDGPRGARMAIECEQAGQQMRLSYHGPSRITTAAELAAGPLSDAPLELLDFELEFAGASDVWDFAADPDMAREPWASSHYEQTGRIRGAVRVSGRELTIDARGHRDHSRGVRKYAPMRNTVWMQGHFPGGRSFAIVHCEMYEGPPTVHAVVFAEGKIYPARNLRLPAMHTIEQQPRSYRVHLESDLGAMDVEAEFAQILPLSLDDHHECIYGGRVLPGFTKLMAIIGPTTLTWNGQQGVGHTELAYGT
jgi:hypothetical protein